MRSWNDRLERAPTADSAERSEVERVAAETAVPSPLVRETACRACLE